VIREVGGERLDGGGVLAIGDKQDPRPIEIDEQADVIVAPACGGLVEGDPDLCSSRHRR